MRRHFGAAIAIATSTSSTSASAAAASLVIAARAKASFNTPAPPPPSRPRPQQRHRLSHCFCHSHCALNSASHILQAYVPVWWSGPSRPNLRLLYHLHLLRTFFHIACAGGAYLQQVLQQRHDCPLLKGT